MVKYKDHIITQPPKINLKTGNPENYKSGKLNRS
jgi:hypothetical protein